MVTQLSSLQPCSQRRCASEMQSTALYHRMALGFKKRLWSQLVVVLLGCDLPYASITRRFWLEPCRKRRLALGGLAFHSQRTSSVAGRFCCSKIDPFAVCGLK